MCRRFHGDAKGKDNLFRERERLIHEVEMLRERLANALTVQEDLERKSSAAEQQCNELTQELEVGTKFCQFWNMTVICKYFML
jgi:chromosome segregation ATPase